jgi:hypothetical protein
MIPKHDLASVSLLQRFSAPRKQQQEITKAAHVCVQTTQKYGIRESYEEFCGRGLFVWLHICVSLFEKGQYTCHVPQKRNEALYVRT